MTLHRRIRAVLDRIAAAARDAGRDPREVGLLLAVKTRTDAEIREALDTLARALPAGSTPMLGHNRVQELAAGGPALDRRADPSVPPHSMHVIGPLQSNKINAALRWATSIDTVHSPELADRLDAAVARHRGDDERLDVLVQVNTSGEESKSGVAPAAAVDLAAHVGSRSHLRLRGLMTIGAHTTDEGRVRASFEDLAALREEILASGAPGTTDARELSMGMSGDLETAIACGATTVRVGTAAFGPRG